MFDFFKVVFGTYNLREKFLIKMLKNIYLFKNCSKFELYHLTKKFNLTDYKSGTLIVKQWQKPSIIWIVEAWKIDAIKEDDWNKTKLWEIKNGSLYAEMSFFNNTIAMASLVAAEDTVVWEISTKDFLEFLQDHDSLFAEIKEVVRQRTNLNKLASS